MEPNTVGVKSYGVKLFISMHSFNALAANDVYEQQWGAGCFYEHADVRAAFDKRPQYTSNHVHKMLGAQRLYHWL